MFIGRFYHRLEAKGRLAIPSTFRKKLEQAIITRGLEGCLFVFPHQEWQKLIEKLKVSPLTKSQARGFTRLMTHDAAPLEFDSQGRARIPDYLQQFAGLKKDVVIAGSLNRVEIWDKVTYHRYIAKVEKNFETIAEELSPLEI